MKSEIRKVPDMRSFVKVLTNFVLLGLEVAVSSVNINSTFVSSLSSHFYCEQMKRNYKGKITNTVSAVYWGGGIIWEIWGMGS